MSSMKNLDDTFNFGDQFLYDKPTEDDQKKSKVREESESTIPDPDQTITSTPPVIAPFTDVTSSKPSLLVTPPPINTEATTITTSLPEITPFIALQLRVARLEQEMSEVKKTDHSADVLERHTADLIKKYSVLPGPESIQNQESKKSLKEIIRIKKEKSAIFKHMNKIKSANRNTANYRLYHALMEALIVDEDAMNKEVADKVKDHKRKHDSDDDEDDDEMMAIQPGSTRVEQRIALSISKLKAARYLDFGLEELVPSLWVESEREYDISAVYGITHWWFGGRLSPPRYHKHSESLIHEHPSETIVFHNEDGNPARANIKQALGYLKDGDGDGNSQPHKGVKASANSDVMYFFTSAQDGDPSQDDVRLCLGDDLKKAQDHSQRQA
ncbi:hypothetical protein Tco_0347148 [Tanacetum coccineum]